MKERERTENGGKKSEETNGNHAISTENGHFIQMSASKVSVLRFLTCHSNGHFSFFLKKKKKDFWLVIRQKSSNEFEQILTQKKKKLNKLYIYIYRKEFHQKF